MNHAVQLIFAAVAGAVAYVVGADIKKPWRALLYVITGATTAVFTAPGLAERFGIHSHPKRMAFCFLTGLVAVTITRALTRWLDRNAERLIGSAITGATKRFVDVPPEEEIKKEKEEPE